MRTVIFGATGRTGNHLVEASLRRGDEVTAVVRDPARLKARHQRLRTVQVADTADSDAVAAAVAGCDVVLSALGSNNGRAPTLLCGDAAIAITKAMELHGVRRLVVISASGLRPEAGDPLPARVIRPILRAVLKNPYADMLRMERIVRDSGLDWTIMRPARLTDKPRTGRYQMAVGRHATGMEVARADLADAMRAVLDDADTSETIVGVAS